MQRGYNIHPAYALSVHPDKDIVTIDGLEGWSKDLEAGLVAGGAKLLKVRKWDRPDYMSLQRCGHKVVALYVQDRRLRDLQFVEGLAELCELSVHDHYESIDFTRLTLLKRLFVEGGRFNVDLSRCHELSHVFITAVCGLSLDPLAKCPRLHTLVLSESNVREYSVLTGLQTVRHLDLTQCDCRNIDFVAAMPALQHLVMVKCRRLVSIEGMRGHPSLRRLEITSCGMIDDLTPVSSLLNVREIEFDAMVVPSADLVLPLTVLEELVLAGTSKFRDGNLAPVLAMPNLRKFIFNNRRHYSHTYEQVRKVLLNRGDTSPVEGR